MKYFQILYYKNGQKRSVGYFDIDDKIEAKNEVLIKTGKWISYYENGQKWKVENFKDGNLNGEFLAWYENGRKLSSGNYLDGMKEGDWIHLWEDGCPLIRTWKDGEDVTFEDGVPF
tara:strand:- start:42 stop:389 length:348 start_codon:yes stop_codon:yes gene_type:complete